MFGFRLGIASVVSMTDRSSHLERAIAHAGSPTALAKKVGVSVQNIFNWKKRGIPAERVPAVVKAVDGAVSAYELRPDLPELFPAPIGCDAGDRQEAERRSRERRQGERRRGDRRVA